MLLIIFLLLFTELAVGFPRGESLRELRKLMQYQDAQAAHLKDFQSEIELWAELLEKFCQEFLQFVEQCRHTGSHCEQRKVQRRLRRLNHNYIELRGQLELLEVKYAKRIRDREAFEPTMKAVVDVLKHYDETLRLVNMEIYKLVQQ